ncbi:MULTISPECIES: Bax inhibitor-1/YccA family protein [unclassified Rhizobium]|uniref:Bax inhibitor-1/YccA family protein n=1 Tax=unclassified Rhizobium TaxID=2613769 RepID=UPI001AD97177|nr:MULTISPECIES: Bax inhibitor-1/YccA family protein [unclassified Rhizobium]MBO9126030.1 Bax inhibitor-1/YccA family protein [Rhizobium sp. 16-488-2b]MBO9176614.1 Bax inhibitor-1/YccA family protein [Rhizobium sp. 16-488-2a]
MADLRNYQGRVQSGVQTGEIDQGLRSYMLKVYNLMAIGLAITGLAAYFAFTFAVSNGQLTAFGAAIYTSPLKWVVIFAPLALVFFLSFRINSMSVSAAQTTFAVYAALVGLSLSSIFLIYTGQSVVQTFFVTAASFGALSLYGYTTRRDLSAMGSFLMMGLFGLIIASIVNIFLASSAMQFAISVIGVLIFAGLTAYDTQRIKEMYYAADATMAGRKAIMGALTLYLDFINLFMFLLQFMGNRK